MKPCWVQRHTERKLSVQIWVQWTTGLRASTGTSRVIPFSAVETRHSSLVGIVTKLYSLWMRDDREQAHLLHDVTSGQNKAEILLAGSEDALLYLLSYSHITHWWNVPVFSNKSQTNDIKWRFSKDQSRQAGSFEGCWPCIVGLVVAKCKVLGFLNGGLWCGIAFRSGAQPLSSTERNSLSTSRHFGQTSRSQLCGNTLGVALSCFNMCTKSMRRPECWQDPGLQIGLLN